LNAQEFTKTAEKHSGFVYNVAQRMDVPLSSYSESPVAATMNSELGNRIDAAINDLPEDLRVAVILRDVQGLSNQEAADTLDVSVSALKARLHRSRIARRDSP